MCLLIVLRGRFASHPVLVAGNRDERTDRKSSPPGLWVGTQRRVLSPRDREKGGTWLGIEAGGMFAGLTNVHGVPVPDGAASRGELPHAALDAGSIDAGECVVRALVATHRFGGFQLVLADAARIRVLRHDGRNLQAIEWGRDVLVVSNEHGPAELELRGLPEAAKPRSTVESQLEALRPLLLDRGGDGAHPVLKHGAGYGTVSSSLIAVPANDPLSLVWRYAAGAPDEVEYRNYGNLGRRLVD